MAPLAAVAANNGLESAIGSAMVAATPQASVLRQFQKLIWRTLLSSGHFEAAHLPLIFRGLDQIRVVVMDRGFGIAIEGV